MVRKWINWTDKAIDTCLLILFTLVFLVGVYFCYDLWYVFGHARDASILAYKPTHTDTRSYQALSDGAIGWITIDDTNIDYPLMQGADNMTYLNTDPYGKFSLSGSIFLDYRNRKEFTDSYSLIYGHHMEYGVMFGALDDFLQSQYFDEHRTGTITVGDQTYELEIFAVVETDDSVKLIFEPTESDPQELLQYLRDNAKYYSEPVGRKIVGLSTCTSTYGSARLAIFASIK